MTFTWLKTAEPLQLSADEVHVWRVPLEVLAADLVGLATILSAEDRDRAERFKSPDARRRFIVAHAALRSLLSRYLNTSSQEVFFVEGTHGKPSLLGSNPTRLNFNLAHSGELALIAVTIGCELGVDVERLREVPHWQEIAGRYFHPAEVKEILACEADSHRIAFFQCWTRKEAILKALGTGLSHPLNMFHVPLDSSDNAWVGCPEQGTGQSVRCYLQPLTLEAEYAAALACLNAERSVRLFE